MHLIVGGTGTLGRIVAQRLLERGKAVRVMTRRPDAAATLQRAGAEIAEGDLLDPASIRRACTGATTVVAAAHSLFGRGRSASRYVDDQGHRRLIDAAREAGVGHFVYTSVYDYGPGYRAVPFVRIKYEVEDHLKASGLAWTIVRPTAFMEVHAHLLIGAPVLTRGKVNLIGRGEQPRNFVAAGDVATIILRALEDPGLRNQTVDVGGPENLTGRDVVRLYERVRGSAARVVTMPVGIARTMSTVLRPVHPGISQVMLMAALADTEDQRFDARPLCERFSIDLTTLEQWIGKNVAKGGAPA